MKTYKMLRQIGSKLYPLFVETNRELPQKQWITAEIGALADKTHVKSRLGPLALRPGFHSCEVPYTNWIGKKGPDGKLYQRAGTVWCECQIAGRELQITDKGGLKTLPNGWYYYRTRPHQLFPWIISDRIYILRILDPEEVERICLANGIQAQPIWVGDGRKDAI